MTWVMFESPAAGNDRLVLLVIADEADDEGGNAYPSVDRIALKARVNRATALRAIARLEAGGALLVLRPEHRGRGRHNRYVVGMGRDPLGLAGELGWPPPRLDPAVAAEWSQNDTIVVPPEPADPTPPSTSPQPGDKPGDDADLKPAKGSERSHERREMVAPGATRPHDPLTRAAAGDTPGDHRPAKPYRRGLDRPPGVELADAAAAAEHANLNLDLSVERPPWLEDAEVPADVDARRAHLAAMRAGRDHPPTPEPA